MRRCFVAMFTPIVALTFQTISLAQTAKYNNSYVIQGFSQPGRLSNVASSISGIVQAREIRAGQRVQAGECLVRLDRSVHDEILNLARIAKDSLGELQNAQAALDGSRSRTVRIRELYESKHATPRELQQAEEELLIARANLQRVKDRRAQQTADYERLLAEANQYEIKAPFDGVVVALVKQVGEYVGPGDSVVCTIAELDTLSVEFLVPRSYRHNLDVGKSVRIFFTVANRTAEGTIEFISPFPNGETNTYTLKARVDNADGKLTAGERCQIRAMNQSKPSARDSSTAKAVRSSRQRNH